jgi:hypothetical protein
VCWSSNESKNSFGGGDDDDVKEEENEDERGEDILEKWETPSTSLSWKVGTISDFRARPPCAAAAIDG